MSSTELGDSVEFEHWLKSEFPVCDLRGYSSDLHGRWVYIDDSTDKMWVGWLGKCRLENSR